MHEKSLWPGRKKRLVTHAVMDIWLIEQMTLNYWTIFLHEEVDQDMQNVEAKNVRTDIVWCHKKMKEELNII